jgi:hypothetical protein
MFSPVIQIKALQMIIKIGQVKMLVVHVPVGGEKNNQTPFRFSLVKLSFLELGLAGLKVERDGRHLMLPYRLASGNMRRGVRMRLRRRGYISIKPIIHLLGLFHIVLMLCLSVLLHISHNGRPFGREPGKHPAQSFKCH